MDKEMYIYIYIYFFFMYSKFCLKNVNSKFTHSSIKVYYLLRRNSIIII